MGKDGGGTSGMPGEGPVSFITDELISLAAKAAAEPVWTAAKERTSCLISVCVPALQLGECLDIDLKPFGKANDRIFDRITELVQDVISELREHIVSATSDGNGAADKLDRLKSNAMKGLAEWKDRLKHAEDGLIKVEAAKQKMNSMREMYYKEVMFLREQLHMKTLADKAGQHFIPEDVCLFDPAEFAFDDGSDLVKVLREKANLLQQRFEDRVAAFKDRIDELTDRLSTSNLHIERQDLLLRGLIVKFGYKDQAQLEEALNLHTDGEGAGVDVDGCEAGAQAAGDGADRATCGPLGNGAGKAPTEVPSLRDIKPPAIDTDDPDEIWAARSPTEKAKTPGIGTRAMKAMTRAFNRAAKPTCDSCGSALTSDSRYCRKCGVERADVAEGTCSLTDADLCGCGSVLMPDADFCCRCGAVRGSSQFQKDVAMGAKPTGKTPRQAGAGGGSRVWAAMAMVTPRFRRGTTSMSEMASANTLSPRAGAPAVVRFDADVQASPEVVESGVQCSLLAPPPETLTFTYTWGQHQRESLQEHLDGIRGISGLPVEAWAAQVRVLDRFGNAVDLASALTEAMFSLSVTCPFVALGTGASSATPGLSSTAGRKELQSPPRICGVDGPRPSSRSSRSIIASKGNGVTCFAGGEARETLPGMMISSAGAFCSEDSRQGRSSIHSDNSLSAPATGASNVLRKHCVPLDISLADLKTSAGGTCAVGTALPVIHKNATHSVRAPSKGAHFVGVPRKMDHADLGAAVAVTPAPVASRNGGRRPSGPSRPGAAAAKLEFTL